MERVDDDVVEKMYDHLDAIKVGLTSIKHALKSDCAMTQNHAADITSAIIRSFDTLMDLHKETIKTSFLSISENAVKIPILVDNIAEKDFITASIKSFVEKLQEETSDSH